MCRWVCVCFASVCSANEQTNRIVITSDANHTKGPKQNGPYTTRHRKHSHKQRFVDICLMIVPPNIPFSFRIHAPLCVRVYLSVCSFFGKVQRKRTKGKERQTINDRCNQANEIAVKRIIRAITATHSSPLYLTPFINSY